MEIKTVADLRRALDQFDDRQALARRVKVYISGGRVMLEVR